jgi:hypothetical protein
VLTADAWLRRELLGVQPQDAVELPTPQLPATAGAANDAKLAVAAAKAQKDAGDEAAAAARDAA